MKFKKGLTAVLTSVVMMFTVAGANLVSAYQPPSAAPSDSKTVYLSTVLNVPNGVSVDPALTFAYKATKGQADAPDLTLDSATFQGVQNHASARFDATKNLPVTITAANFPHAGTYSYTITQDNDAVRAALQENPGVREDLTKSEATYTLTVVVVNKTGGGLAINQVQVNKGNSISADPAQKVDGDTNPGDGSDGRSSEFKFVNHYDKTIVSAPDRLDGINANALRVSKKVTGSLGDKTQTFAFNINITSSLRKAKAAIYGEDGAKIQDVAIQDGDVAFNLKHGQTLAFYEMPSGLKYLVTETQADSYDAPAYAQTVGGTAVNGNNEVQFVKDGGKNELVVTNNRDAQPLTGIRTQNLPYLLLMLVALGGLIFFLIKKNRRADAKR